MKKFNAVKAMVGLTVVASVIGANASTITNGIPNGDHVIQGNFQAGNPDVFLQDNGNSGRCGTGGATGSQRVNEPILQFTLPIIPAGEAVNAATFSFKMASTAVTKASLTFDMVVCLMNSTDVSEISALDFVETNAPINTALGNGIVIAQFEAGDVENGATVDISLTGAALDQLSAMYNATGIPIQPDIWFRMSTSTHLDMTTNINHNARFQFDKDAEGDLIRSLELNWGTPPEDAYYVAETPTSWADGLAWSDGNPASSNSSYFVTNNVALQTPSTTATFPGLDLDLVGSQSIELMVSGSDVITFAPLELGADTLAAGVVDTDEAKVDGTINVVANSSFTGATNDSRNLRILSQVTGSTSVELSAPTKTVYIDNAGNTFSGSWVVSGGTGEFTSSGAVGPAGIAVQSNATLRILGDWDGLSLGGTLSAADAATVEVGANEWTVSSLTIGTNVVAEGAVYTTVELNALGAAVFNGAGTIQVGNLPLPEPGEVIAAWDTWNSTTAPVPSFMATDISAAATASAVGGTADWANYDSETDPGRGSSKDTTWGTFDGGGSSASSVTTAGTANFTLTNGKTDGEITFTINNTGGEAIALGQIHFDAVAFRPNAARTYAVNVLEGSDITIGSVFTSENDAITHLNGNLKSDDEDPETHDQHDDIDLSLTGLADHTLEAGESAIIQLAFSSGTGSGGGHHLFVDNVAITAEGDTPVEVPEPPAMSIEASGSDVIISWSSLATFQLQTRPSITSGDWADYPGGTNSPVTVPATMAAEFMRLLWQE